MVKKIDYDNSLVALASSVLKRFGAEATHTTLKDMDDLLAKGYENVVVMLFDGMGTAILDKHKEASPFLRAHIKRTISSVFPPTTTAATTSVQSGLTPYEHGWLGWSLWFEEVGKTINLFPNTEFVTDVPFEDFNVAKTVIPYKSIEEKINEVGKAKAYFISRFATIKADSLQDIADNVQRLCAESGEKYIYTYWSQPDHDMHDFGTTDERISTRIKEINDCVESLCSKLKNTLVVVVADHGLVDVRWQTLLDYPDVWECLERVPSIESRALTFFVKEGMKDLFKHRFLSHFSDEYIFLSHEEVVREGIFGSGEQCKKFNDFIGDYLAIATNDLCLDVRPIGEFAFNAMHAGLCEDELNVPFIVVET